MEQQDNYLEQQLQALQEEMAALAEQYKRQCFEQMVSQIQKEVDAFNRPPSCYKQLWYRTRVLSSRGLFVLARWINPMQTTVEDPDDGLEHEPFIDADITDGTWYSTFTQPIHKKGEHDTP
jgi:hypothetical protein